MKTTTKVLCAAYGLIAVAALYLTWSNNFAFMADGPSGFEGAEAFIEASHANFAASSIAWDLAAACIAGVIFMLVEARRIGMRFVSVYILLSLLVAYGAMFPLFLLHRELYLAQRAARPEATLS